MKAAGAPPGADEAFVARALAKAGFPVESVWDLVNTSTPHPHAIAPLVECLSEVQDLRTREGIARALTVKGAGAEAVDALLAAFRAPDADDGLRWAVGNAVATIGFELRHEPVLLDLCRDRRWGRGRQMLVGALHRIRSIEIEPILIGLLDDPEVAAFAVRSLQFCGGVPALIALRRIDAGSASPLMRRSLRTAIRRLEKRCG